MVAHTFNPSTQEAEAGGSLEFEVSLVYRVSSRTVRATQGNPVSGGGGRTFFFFNSLCFDQFNKLAPSYVNNKGALELVVHTLGRQTDLSVSSRPD
jgi:YHS domain-containing protein